MCKAAAQFSISPLTSYNEISIPDALGHYFSFAVLHARLVGLLVMRTGQSFFLACKLLAVDAIP